MESKAKRDVAMSAASLGMAAMQLPSREPLGQARLFGALAGAVIASGFNLAANIGEENGTADMIGLDPEVRAMFLASFAQGFEQAPLPGVMDVVAAAVTGYAAGTPTAYPEEVAAMISERMAETMGSEEGREAFEELRLKDQGPHGAGCTCPEEEDGPALVDDEAAAELRRMFEAGD